MTDVHFFGVALSDCQFNLILPPLLLVLTPSFALLLALEENGCIGNGFSIQCCNISALRVVYFRDEKNAAGF